MKFSIVVLSLALVVCTQSHSLGTKNRHYDLYSAKCPEPTGQFPHEQFCEMFINCWEGRAVVQKCGPGMEFDAKTKACGFCEEVDCGTRVKQNAC